MMLLTGAPPPDVSAMALATATIDGTPSVRMVLLKGVDNRGFIFFTNYDSRKGRELAENPKAALVFYWAELERQISVTGEVTKLPVAESESYFRSRPKGSRLGAWASPQSRVVASREDLEKNWDELERRYPTNEIPCPPYWGGYVLSPQRIEFWQGGPNRLHDRFCYVRQPDNTWKIERLAP
jgi:pyridoxamine 5'-phosphate oxidase